MSDSLLREFDTRETLDQVLAAELAGLLAAAIDERGEATLALSGGSTPRGVLRELGRADLDWQRVATTLVDERWVDASHEDSNERMVRETLFGAAASAASFVPLVVPGMSAEAARAEVESRLERFATFDAMMLGMGGDGHFASLFPGSAALEEGLDRDGVHSCIAVDPPAAPHARMSMTLPRILETRRLILHITGQDKRAVLERARRERDPLRLPIAALLDVTAPALEIYWAP